MNEVKRFIEALRRKRTKEHYKKVLGRFVRDTGKDLGKINQDDVLDWKTEIEKTLAIKSVQNYVNVLRSFLKFNYGDSAVSKIKVPYEFKIKEVPYNLDNIREIIRVADNTKLRDAVAIRLLAQTGIRLGELLSIMVEDINFTEKVIKIKGKGGRERFVGIFYEDTLNMLKNYIKNKKKGYLFTITPRAMQFKIKEYAKKAGMKEEDVAKATCHGLRHAFAMEYLNVGGRLEILQKLLGHSSLATTGMYLSYTPKVIMEESAKVMEKIKF
ncbi:MAG: tyrosine-type recombinase/integrase [Bacillota bacterium]